MHIIHITTSPDTALKETQTQEAYVCTSYP